MVRFSPFIPPAAVVEISRHVSLSPRNKAWLRVLRKVLFRNWPDVRSKGNKERQEGGSVALTNQCVKGSRSLQHGKDAYLMARKVNFGSVQGSMKQQVLFGAETTRR